MNRFRPHRLAAGLILTTLVVLFVATQLFLGVQSAGRRVGVILEATPDGLQVTGLTPEGPAERAGLQAGDLLVSLDGRSVTNAWEYDQVAASYRRGEPVRAAVLRDGVAIERVIVPGTPVPWGQYLLTALVTLGYTALALLTLRQRSGDIRGWLLFLFSGAVALELALPTQLVGSAGIAVGAVMFFYILTGSQIGLELHLASIIPEPRRWFRSHRCFPALFYGVGLAAGGTAALALLADLRGWFWVPALARRVGPLLINYGLPLWASAVVLILLGPALRHAERDKRAQAGLVLLGVLPWMVYVYLGRIFAILDFTTPALYSQLEPVVLMAFPVAVFVAIFRYQLFDIQFVLRGSMLYTSLTGLLILVFYASVGVGGAMFSRMLEGGRDSLWVFAGATLILGLLFAPLRQWLQRVIDRQFFPERYALRQRLTDLAAELPRLGKLSLMGKHLISELCTVFGLRSGTLLVADPASSLLVTVAATTADPEQDFTQSFLLTSDDPGLQQLRREARPSPTSPLVALSAALAQRFRLFDAELVVPLLSRGELAGVLILGPKESGTRYTAEEVELLGLLSHLVATVVENARLFSAATTDSLTGLPRREAILELLERERRRAIRYERPLAVGMADLDHFKEINDRHGHLAGDAILNRVAQVMASNLRTADAVGRYGGEEFLLVLPETDMAGAAAVADKVVRAVAQIPFRLDDGQTVQTTVSIGLAQLGPGVGTVNSTELLAAADRNLLTAKGKGRNRIEPQVRPPNAAPPGPPAHSTRGD